ncbi:MAG: hypothetical protein P8P88_04595 [Polaribacter sp.]|nr:hypothetical protein [Polaribacter sp.]
MHSPFVFDFVTKSLYKNNQEIINFDNYLQLEYLSKKKIKILSKIVSHFQLKEICFNFSEFKKIKSKNYKLLYIKNIEKLQQSKFTNLTSNDIIIVDGIYSTKKSAEVWQEIIKNKEVQITINLFYFGLIFFRKEQAKEHFRIRV